MLSGKEKGRPEPPLPFLRKASYLDTGGARRYKSPLAVWDWGKLHGPRSMNADLKVYSNRKPDFIRNAFLYYASPPKQVMLASPFFSNAPLVEDLVRQGCSVQLIVRLGEATSPDHLRTIMGSSRVHVRFFTARTFHSKLYIFGSEAALVGSANLTDSGINSNQEICIEVPGGTNAFDELLSIF